MWHRRLLAAAISWTATTQSAQVPERDMIGTWAGYAQIVVKWTDQPSIHVLLVILAGGAVSGEVGNARIAHGRITANRGPVGRFLHIKTDYIVSGELEGPVIAAEHVLRDGVKLPLNWDGTAFTGSVHTTGSMFGGADRMVFTAMHLQLTRQPSGRGAR